MLREIAKVMKADSAFLGTTKKKIKTKEIFGTKYMEEKSRYRFIVNVQENRVSQIIRQVLHFDFPPDVFFQNLQAVQ